MSKSSSSAGSTSVAEVGRSSSSSASQGGPVADVGSRVACEGRLSESGSGVAIGAVPHTVVEGRMRCWIEVLSVAKQQIVNISLFGGGTR
uniref:Uncharacterized protein n=1 Tax=Romanomermis culicivorax TaxID=13658 RepID=A0A915HYZ0_ROMCU